MRQMTVVNRRKWDNLRRLGMSAAATAFLESGPPGPFRTMVRLI
jgi:hypothetical protein